MNLDLTLVLLMLAAAIAMFVINRPRMDAVALLVMVATPFTGIITMNEALAGFADPSIILIAALFVIGEGLVMTGVARRLARREGRRERSARRPGLLRGLPVQPQGGDERRPMA